MRNKIINFGVVGCGYWGPNLIRNLRNLAQCRVKTVCDLNSSRLKHIAGLHPGVKTTTDFRLLLEKGGVDAVVIATPVRHHFALAKASLLARKHVLIEKPMASSSAECSELIAIAERLGLVLMVGHTFLYSGAVRKISEIIDSGELGDVRYINARRLNLGVYQKDINVAWDLAPHDLSIALHLLKESPLTVNCQGNAHVTPGIEDVTNLSLVFRNNRFVTIQSSWMEPRKVREMTIVGSRRMLVYDDLRPQECIRVFDARVEAPRHYDTFGEFQYAYHYGDSHIPHFCQEEPLKTECQHFLDCIQNGTVPLTDGRAGLELVRILEASSTSLKNNGAPVSLGGNITPMHPLPVPSPEIARRAAAL
jgi:predicted dehydrogenase